MSVYIEILGGIGNKNKLIVFFHLNISVSLSTKREPDEKTCNVIIIIMINIIAF